MLTGYSTGLLSAWRPLGGYLLLIAAALLTACASEVNFDQPPEIIYGEDVCERCSMIINEARYAAAYVTADGQPHLFDDIGGMLAQNREVADDVVVFWVHDFVSEQWLKAEAASYVKGDQITPMGFGIIAFANRDQADAWATEEGGLVMTFSDLLAEEQASVHDH